MMSYNFRSGYAILSYLEYPIILIQELILIFLVLKYKGFLNIFALFASGFYFSVTAGFLMGMVPIGLLAFLVVSNNRVMQTYLWYLIGLQPLCTPIGASSKVVQLVEILRTKNAQSVSILTWFISAFTNFSKFSLTLNWFCGYKRPFFTARVFTIMMESADLTLLLNFVINTILSSSVMVAAYLYKNSKPEIAKKNE